MAKSVFNLLKNIPPREKRLTLPTLFTLLRIILVPFIIACMIENYWGTAFMLFLIASFTDIVDGALARWWDEQTFLGACLDPIADKLLLLSIFFTLAFVQTPLFIIPRWFVFCVLFKEVFVMAGAFLIYKTKDAIHIRPTLLGKMSTFIQIIFISWLFACYFFQWMPVKTYYTMLGLVLTVICLSFSQYISLGIQQLKDEKL